MGIHDIGSIATGTQIDGKETAGKEYLSFRDVFGFIRRKLLILGAFTIIGLTLGIAYLAKTPPTYLATTRLVMDPEQGRIASQDVSTGTVIIETAEIASQVEIVKSEAIAEDVIRQLGLTTDPEILSNSSWQSLLRGAVLSARGILMGTAEEKASRPPSAEEAMRRTMVAFLSRVSVRRVGQSYVLEISYRSSDPQKAAATANALAQAYIRVGMNDRADAAKIGAKWLESRLIEVGRQGRQAAMAAEEFRNRNGIKVVGNSSTLDQQQLSEISSQMLAVRAATAAEAAKLTTLSRVIEGGTPTDNADEAGINPQVQKLREDIRLAETRLANLRSRYSAGNPAISAAQAEISRLTSAVEDEFRRIESVYRSNLEVAQTRERLVEAEFSSITESGEGKNIARVELSEMESRANTYRRMYEGILQQLVSTLQTQSFPLGRARIVTAATAPFGKTWPKPSIVLPLSMVLGAATGLMATILQSGLDRRVSSSERLRRELGIASLGHVPVYRQTASLPGSRTVMPAALLPLRCVLDMPYSQFSESLRGVKSSLDAAFQTSTSMVIGITSVGPGEGKTTIATNLAQLYQNEGWPVMLIDADFVGARLSRVATNAAADFGMSVLRPSAAAERTVTLAEAQAVSLGGYGETLVAENQEERLPEDQRTGQPRTVSVPVLTVEQIRQSAVAYQRYGHLPALKAGIERLRRRYKVIIVDMSAFEESADTRTICTYLDGVVLVLGNSNKMTIERLADALATFGKSQIALLGVILNRSDLPDRDAARNRSWKA